MSRSSWEIMQLFYARTCSDHRRALRFNAEVPAKVNASNTQDAGPITRSVKLHPVSFADQLGFTFKAPERRVWMVRDLVAAVRTHVEREYADIWVEGEISNFRAQASSGHLYFTLKDEECQVRAVMFRAQARLL